MKEQVTNEFIQYKSGFIAGKHEILEAYKLGKVINLNDSVNNEPKKSWFQFGYDDGFNYFSKLIDEGLSLDINTRLLVKEEFTKRVLKYNQEENKEIPISKFRI